MPTDAELAQGEANVAIAFELIRSAAGMLTLFPYAEAAASLRRQIDAAYYVDPTTILRISRDRGDMDRKLRLLDAAARFVGEWDAVRLQALGNEPGEGVTG